MECMGLGTCGAEDRAGLEGGALEMTNIGLCCLERPLTADRTVRGYGVRVRVAG